MSSLAVLQTGYEPQMAVEQSKWLNKLKRQLFWVHLCSSQSLNSSQCVEQLDPSFCLCWRIYYVISHILGTEKHISSYNCNGFIIWKHNLHWSVSLECHVFLLFSSFHLFLCYLPNSSFHACEALDRVQPTLWTLYARRLACPIIPLFVLHLSCPVVLFPLLHFSHLISHIRYLCKSLKCTQKNIIVLKIFFRLCTDPCKIINLHIREALNTQLRRDDNISDGKLHCVPLTF